MINLMINNMPVTAEEGATILDAAKIVGVSIPTLCHMNFHGINMINQSANCRVCMVEVEGARTLIPACATVVTEGMVVRTNSPRAVNARRAVVELILSDHPKDCLVCEKNMNCELQALAATLNIKEFTPRGRQRKHPKDISNYSLIRDPEKCILCRRCETMCNNIQSVGVYSVVRRGFDAVMGTAFDEPMPETCCTFCGQCVSVCPTGALTHYDNLSEVWAALNDPEKFVIAQTAPAVRVALGEMFGMEAGSRVTGKMVSALRAMGFRKVYDTNFAADLTIVEEAHELLDRLKNGGALPMLTSCCPAWVRFIEIQFPDLLQIPSTCKSPHEMLGAVAKTYLAEKLGVAAEKIVVVSVMPCLAKKYESARPELSDGAGRPYVDYAISTRELARMINEAGLNFHALPDEDFDDVMGESSGAAVIFGATGGVAEAAVRSAVTLLGGKPPEKIEFEELRGMDGIRKAAVNAGGTELKVAISHGLGNARKLLEAIRRGEADYQLIEIMACPGGCVGGGGQPFYREDAGVINARARAIYEEDRDKPNRLSHENAEVKRLYDEFLGAAGGEKAHELLHVGVSH